MKSDKQYRDSAFGAFVGWIGILVMCIVIVIIEHINI